MADLCNVKIAPENEPDSAPKPLSPVCLSPAFNKTIGKDKTTVTEQQINQEHPIRRRQDDPDRAYKVLIADLVGLKFDASGRPDHSEVQGHIESKGGEFHDKALGLHDVLETGKLHFFYQPDLSQEQEILDQTVYGQYDATIAAAIFFPAAAKFDLGGVRIGAGTGNMGSASWGGGNGEGGVAALMNTPSFNSRATAQMAMKALLKVCLDLPVDEMHDKVVAGTLDTGRNLCDYPTERIESKRIALIGYGNIGRELAKLAQAFGMTVVIYARPAHKDWIESEGFIYASTPVEAAHGADVISPHTGLGSLNAETGLFGNAGLIDEQVFEVMNPGSIVINYDRGEIIDSAALDQALATAKVSYAGIDAGAKTVNGVGKVTPQDIVQAGGNNQVVNQLADMSAQMADFWRAMADADSEQQREDLTKAEGAALVMNINRSIVQLDVLGLRGPYAG